MKESAGTLLYRWNGPALEVLLVHPSGNYNRRAPWSIPKGLPEEGESLESAARRETLEETGIVAGELVPLTPIVYKKTRKRVHCFSGPAPGNCDARCATWEIDQAEFFPLVEARRRIHPDQAPFLDELEWLLRSASNSRS